MLKVPRYAVMVMTERLKVPENTMLSLAELSDICGYYVTNCNNFCRQCNPCSYPGQKRIAKEGWSDPKGCESHGECLPNTCPIALPKICTGCSLEDGRGEGCWENCWREHMAVNDWDIGMFCRAELTVGGE